jgi:hypothetical protein
MIRGRGSQRQGTVEADHYGAKENHCIEENSLIKYYPEL